MFTPGSWQELYIVKTVRQGVYLAETPDGGKTAEARVLLPHAQVPEGAKEGNALRVFLYFDSEDRLIATVHEPALTLGKVARLTVAGTSAVGAFLDWGLEKDLFLPFAEQTRRVRTGDTVLAALYADKSGRLCATMNVYPYLETFSPYHKGQTVEGEIYAVLPNFGAYVAVDDRYSAMIPKQEVTAAHSVGTHVKLRVAAVTEDGKLTLAARELAYKAMDSDAISIYNKIDDDFDGELPFDDSASPERIREVFGISKAAFKRAVGKLYRERKIELKDGRIRNL